MDYICRTKCFHRNRVWAEGEILQPVAGEQVPAHFEKVGVKVEEKKPVVKTKTPKSVKLDEVKTMSEMTKHDAEAEGFLE